MALWKYQHNRHAAKGDRFTSKCTVLFAIPYPSLKASSQTETATLEFRNPRLERLVALTPADRKWIEEIVRDVNDSWDDTDPTKAAMQYVISPSDLSCMMLNSSKFQG